MHCETYVFDPNNRKVICAVGWSSSLNTAVVLSNPEPGSKLPCGRTKARVFENEDMIIGEFD